MHIAVALVILRPASAPKQQQVLVWSFTLTPETGRHFHCGGSNSANVYYTHAAAELLRSLENFPGWMDYILTFEEKVLAGWIGTSTSYFCRSHAPPTLLILKRISETGCDSPVLAVEGSFLLRSHNECRALSTAFISPLIVSHSVLQSLMCVGIVESTLFYWNLHAVKIWFHTHTLH